MSDDHGYVGKEIEIFRYKVFKVDIPSFYEIFYITFFFHLFPLIFI